VPIGTPPVFASPLLLREALANLVSNAVKYTPNGGHIRIAAAPGEAETVVIAVTDTGVGLSAADQERLFTRYFRSADPRVGQERGSGLGLALTRSVVEQMGGRITVESTLNHGTTFAILLPAAARQA
jgi:signal transduction histidine kinase